MTNIEKFEKLSPEIQQQLIEINNSNNAATIKK